MKKLLLRAADRFSIPADAVTNIFHMELLGDREIYLENHKGITEYSENEIVLCGENRMIRICGSNLNLCTMTDTELRVSGTVDSIVFTSL